MDNIHMVGWFGVRYCDRCGAPLVTEAGYAEPCEECEHLSDEELEALADSL